ncbi:hypothetical protein HYH03_015602 [Edaphochlamys debaryana]|uniref:Guanylate-binding protein N-terminal domain-containing protein n=1 Tax=Edaphochlamys debaryana TaxID=47281 RepID=A0A835XKD7_9CHLO|nr:hypothetical protein HYH03_015602 [Edaphochlamys debaryana]|eukprot:KAG2485718.1 hypothetical protein HYH03_015602 [Edaphochlamys debaryana]
MARNGPAQPWSGTARRLLRAILLAVAAWGWQAGASTYEARPIPLVLPLESKSQLAVQPEGLELLRSIAGPVSPVVVIGPYRSGKSFTLNQLLGVPCDKGFGVGHTRSTETKGIWLWGTPLPRGGGAGAGAGAAKAEAGEGGAGSGKAGEQAGGEEGKGAGMMLYVDTEGFESTGKANTYDDRIFALSALLSSLLIYNLPETIRESDVAKLSFAVELAQGFYDRQQEGAGAAEGSSGSVEPGSMLWLIQRDFLQGQNASDLVRSVLRPVPNPEHDPGLDALNQVRASLSALARNSTGFSLRQPHLDRTKLCELADDQLDPGYVKQRDELKALVRSLAAPKVLNGRQLDGAALAGLVTKMVDALNEQEIPTGASLLASFNRDLLARCAANYTAALAAVQLPADESDLAAAELTARVNALEMLKTLQIGRLRGVDTKADLAKELERAYQVRRTENLAASNAMCSELENKCEAELDAMQGMRLPSLRKFEASHRHCEKAFLDKCTGPAKQANVERLDKAWARASKAFGKDYNDRLFTGLLVASLAAAVLFRFVIRIQLLEIGAWAAFLFLELYPKLHSTGSMYDSKGWALTVKIWEWAMVLLLGFNGAGVVWVVVAVVLLGMRFCYSRRRRRGGGTGGGGGGSGSGGWSSGSGAVGGGGDGGFGGMLWAGGTRRKQLSTRDLDV